MSKTVTGGADDGTTSYEYDTFDRLMKVKKDGTLVFAAEYDYRTRRILKLDPGPNGGARNTVDSGRIALWDTVRRRRKLSDRLRW